jgi:hypothetical protein
LDCEELLLLLLVSMLEFEVVEEDVELVFDTTDEELEREAELDVVTPPAEDEVSVSDELVVDWGFCPKRR